MGAQSVGAGKVKKIIGSPAVVTGHFIQALFAKAAGLLYRKGIKMYINQSLIQAIEQFLAKPYNTVAREIEDSIKIIDREIAQKIISTEEKGVLETLRERCLLKKAESEKPSLLGSSFRNLR